MEVTDKRVYRIQTLFDVQKELYGQAALLNIVEGMR